MARWRQTLLLYLYSNGHIAGCVLALAGLALVFAGIVRSYAWLIVAGLYAIGVLLTPYRRSPNLRIAYETLDAGAIETELNRLLTTVRKRVPLDIFKLAEHITQSIVTILPYLSNRGVGDQNVVTIQNTALDYLPQALQNYLKLPRAYAELHPVKDGKTARQLLQEQLSLLDRAMDEIVADVLETDAQRLLVHGRFLQEKFQTPDDWLVAGRQ